MCDACVCVCVREMGKRTKALSLLFCDIYFIHLICQRGNVHNTHARRNGKVLKFNVDEERICLIGSFFFLYSHLGTSIFHRQPCSSHSLTWNISTSRNVQSPLVMPSACAASINFRTKWPRTDNMTTANFNQSFASNTIHSVQRSTVQRLPSLSPSLLIITMTVGGHTILNATLTSGVHAGVSQIVIIRLLFVSIQFSHKT